MRILLAALILLTSSRADAQDSGPVVVVHYMPWFQAPETSGYWGWHWTMNHFDPNRVGADGQREIASHTYPEIGPYDSHDPDVIEYHALLMRVAGIDGTVADWYGTSTLYDYPLIDEATGMLFDAMGDVGLQFAICYEDATLTQLVSQGVIEAGREPYQALADLEAVAQRWAGDDRYLRHDGAPVLLNFGPQNQVMRSSRAWEVALDGFVEAPALVTQDSRLARVAAGAFPWPPMHASVNGTLTMARLDQYLGSFYASATDWPLAMGGVWPGFHDIYEQAGVSASYGYLDDRDGATFAETFQRAIDSGVPIIQIATWNDFGEGTAIEPTAEFGTRYLEQIQTAVRGWRDLPFQPDDLELPLRLYHLRQSQDVDLEVDARLDEAAALLAAGDPAAARAVLDGFATATESSPLPVTITVGPNPARDLVTVAVTLPAAADLKVEILDVTGRTVARLVEGARAAGILEVEWDAAGDRTRRLPHPRPGGRARSDAERRADALTSRTSLESTGTAGRPRGRDHAAAAPSRSPSSMPARTGDSTAVSVSTTPSRRRTTRRAWAAISSSCVTTSSVLP